MQMYEATYLGYKMVVYAKTKEQAIARTKVSFKNALGLSHLDFKHYSIKEVY